MHGKHLSTPENPILREQGRGVHGFANRFPWVTQMVNNANQPTRRCSAAGFTAVGGLGSPAGRLCPHRSDPELDLSQPFVVLIEIRQGEPAHSHS